MEKKLTGKEFHFVNSVKYQVEGFKHFLKPLSFGSWLFTYNLIEEDVLDDAKMAKAVEGDVLARLVYEDASVRTNDDDGSLNVAILAYCIIKTKKYPRGWTCMVAPLAGEWKDKLTPGERVIEIVTEELRNRKCF